MTPRSLEQLNKSTTGRIVNAGMRLLDSVAPAAAQRLAFDWFGRPRRRVGRPAIGAHRFRLTGDGPELAVWDWGDGPTVLLVHGWNGNAAQLAGLVPPLLRAGYYVATPDLPAHGARESFDLLRLAPSQTARTLVLHAPADREVPLADAQALAQAWPGARLEMLEGAGHTRALRHPDVISRAVGFVTDRTLALSA